jgi:D-alanine-D-alanine ligase
VRVAVLAGGRSSEHEVSLSSGASVADGLRDAGHEVVQVVLGREGDWRCDGEEVVLRAGRGLLGADAAFPVLHGPFGEDGTVQGLLELLAVPYVGSGVLASAICLDKVVFKDVMAQAGLPQVAYAGLRGLPGAEPSEEDVERVRALGFPCWVKPARLGSSVGIVRVDGPDDLAGALRRAFEHDPHVIAEASASGAEVECSVLGHTGSPRTSEPGEIVLTSDGWYDFAAKYEPGGMELGVPARISPAARERVQELARAAFTTAGCSGLARADFFVDGDEVLLNELNTMPGFTQTSVYGKLWTASGLPYSQLVDRLVSLAVERHAEERAYTY